MDFSKEFADRRVLVVGGSSGIGAAIGAAFASAGAKVTVTGATEAECLRAARGLRDQWDRDAFGRMVRVWQYAAYAERLPDDGEFEGLLGQLGGRFGWAA